MNPTYAYSGDWTRYPILGSLVRALGKGWHVLVIVPEQEKNVVEKIRSLLLDPSSLTICTLQELARGDQQSKDMQFVLSLCELPIERGFFSSVPIMTRESAPDKEQYDLISSFQLHHLHPTGVTAMTGTGKGKTTSALGMGVEVLANGGKVAVVQWFKEERLTTPTTGPSWAINEHQFPRTLRDPSKFVFYPTGAGFVGSPTMDRVHEKQEHQERAMRGIQIATDLIQSGEYAMVILDELLDTLQQVMPSLPYSLLELFVVQKLLTTSQHSPTQVVVTGRRVTPEWEAFVGESLRIDEVKHPWSTRHAGAISGLDY